jgi:hypothetical protein
MTLKLDPNLSDPDGFYAALIDAHEALDAEASAALNARQIQVLANQNGDLVLLKAALDVAK